MRKISMFLLLPILFAWSCGKEPETAQVDETIAEVASTMDVPVDPDTTDQIPGGQYLIDASSEKTASLVRERLNQLFTEDLKIGIIDSLSRKFIFFEFDLNGDQSKEILVGLTGPYFCGSGGCTQFILNDKGEVLSKFTVSDYPVVIAPDKTNGWSDLYILSGGDYRVVKFNGKTYPSNPSVLPKLGMLPGDGLPRALDFMNDNYPWFSF
ncbi:hypothetical protein [Algoriphagus sp. A40]|uniref:hypothetical protein n=1 Tax=Algoriphagus sp. A40 TaxID=1945863 RepID=UPI000984BF8F|nr:hypothetical protein [Algoriphagus sp. A40]OOG77808.1 hypothetical protein B0E43_03320 [Algoriphagus sp. A40]